VHGGQFVLPSQRFLAVGSRFVDQRSGLFSDISPPEGPTVIATAPCEGPFRVARVRGRHFANVSLPRSPFLSRAPAGDFARVPVERQRARRRRDPLGFHGVRGRLLAGARFARLPGGPRDLSRRKEREVDGSGGEARGPSSISATEIDLLSGGCSRFAVQELHRRRISGRALGAWCFSPRSLTEIVPCAFAVSAR
jgi:hypothetical protein